MPRKDKQLTKAAGNLNQKITTKALPAIEYIRNHSKITCNFRLQI